MYLMFNNRSTELNEITNLRLDLDDTLLFKDQSTVLGIAKETFSFAPKV